LPAAGTSIGAPNDPLPTPGRYRHVAGFLLTHREVDVRVAVEVGSLDLVRVAGQRVGHGGAEAAVAVADQHRRLRRLAVGRGQVGRPVLVQVGDDDVLRVARRPAHRSDERDLAERRRRARQRECDTREQQSESPPHAGSDPTPAPRGGR
jgi:hypothetical protein